MQRSSPNNSDRDGRDLSPPCSFADCFSFRRICDFIRRRNSSEKLRDDMATQPAETQRFSPFLNSTVTSPQSPRTLHGLGYNLQQKPARHAAHRLQPIRHSFMWGWMRGSSVATDRLIDRLTQYATPSLMSTCTEDESERFGIGGNRYLACGWRARKSKGNNGF
jgi:hypothetical protein